jgi:hypothetical protein
MRPSPSSIGNALLWCVGIFVWAAFARCGWDFGARVQALLRL